VDGVRLLQGLGIYESIFTEVGQSKIRLPDFLYDIELMLVLIEMGYFNFISGAK
jgi:hypothetical protein